MPSEHIYSPESAVEALRQARRARGLTQAELALAVDCAQSGVSRLEAGNLNALADDKIRQLADFLGIKIDLRAPAKGLQLVSNPTRRLFQHCASPWCPSCLPFTIHGVLHLWPALQPLTPDHPSNRCTFCGEPMKNRCLKCAHGVDEPGAFCNQCGESRVRLDAETASDVLRDRHVLAGEAKELFEATQLVALLAGSALPQGGAS